MARVLVASDGSQFAMASAQRGLSLVAPGVEVTVITVVPLISPMLGTATTAAGGVGAPAFNPEVLRETQDVRRATARTRLDAAVAILGGGAEGLIKHGEPGATICDVAGKGGFDLIIMGSHGAGLLKRALLGSVSEYVMHHAPCPVLVVRNSTAEDGA